MRMRALAFLCLIRMHPQNEADWKQLGIYSKEDTTRPKVSHRVDFRNGKPKQTTLEASATPTSSSLSRMQKAMALEHS